MASLFESLFTGAGGSPTASQQEGRSSSQTYYSDPALVSNISNALSGLQQNLTGQYQGLLQDPTASPLFQGQLGPLLQSLVPSEDRARQNLTDTFRAAGGLRGGAYARAIPQLEGEILGQRQQAAGRLLGQAFPQLMQALQQPMSQIAPLINALTLSQQQGAISRTGGTGTSGWNAISPSLGLATPMQGDRMASTQGSSTYAPPASGPSFYDNPANRWGAMTPTSYPELPGTTPGSTIGSYGGLEGSGIMYNPLSGSYESAPGDYNEWGAGQYGTLYDTLAGSDYEY